MRLENFWIFTKFDKIHAGFLRSGSANAIIIVPFRLLCKLKAVGVLNGMDLTEAMLLVITASVSPRMVVQFGERFWKTRPVWGGGNIKGVFYEYE